MIIFLLIIFGLLSLILLYLIYISIYDFVYYLKLLKNYYHSYMLTGDFGYLIAISGMIRAGKTIFMHGITHVFVLKIKEDLTKRMYDIEAKLIGLNFLEIKNDFIRYANECDTVDDIINLIIDSFIDKSDVRKNYFKGLSDCYFDGLKYKKKIDMLKDYLKYFYHINRIDHVFSNIESWNQITKSYSKDYKLYYMQLKNQYQTKKFDFPLEEFSVFNYDEQLLVNKNDNDPQRRNEDSGTDIFLRLFGQIFKETSRYITTLQDINRWFKTEREIMQTFPFIHKSSLVFYKPKKHQLICRLESINNWIYNKFHKNEDFRAEENRFKRRNLKYIQAKEKIVSNSFIAFDNSIYSRIDDVGKFIKPEDYNRSQYSETFYYPVCYTWDIGNTHAYSKIFDYFKKQVRMNKKDIYSVELNEEMIEELLKKTNDKLSSNTSVKTDVQAYNKDFYS